MKGFAYILADFLSLITIGLCLVLKVPQILTLWQTKSAHGINIYGLMLELLSLTIMFCYNFCNGYALLSYLEYPIILVQEYDLIYLVLLYSDNINITTITLSTIYFGTVYAYLADIADSSVLNYLAPCCTPIGATSKVVQLYEIVKTKDSENISLTTWVISVFTNLTRIYTVYMDSGDKTLLANFTVAASLSSGVLIAAAYYKKPKVE